MADSSEPGLREQEAGSQSCNLAHVVVWSLMLNQSAAVSGHYNLVARDEEDYYGPVLQLCARRKRYENEQPKESQPSSHLRFLRRFQVYGFCPMKIITD